MHNSVSFVLLVDPLTVEFSSVTYVSWTATWEYGNMDRGGEIEGYIGGVALWFRRYERRGLKSVESSREQASTGPLSGKI